MTRGRLANLLTHSASRHLHLRFSSSPLAYNTGDSGRATVCHYSVSLFSSPYSNPGKAGPRLYMRSLHLHPPFPQPLRIRPCTPFGDLAIPFGTTLDRPSFHSLALSSSSLGILVDNCAAPTKSPTEPLPRFDEFSLSLLRPAVPTPEYQVTQIWQLSHGYQFRVVYSVFITGLHRRYCRVVSHPFPVSSDSLC